MLNSGRHTIIFPPFGSLSAGVPPVLPFLRLHFERLFFVRVNCGGISDGLGSVGDGECSVGYGGPNCLSFGRDEAPEDIGSDGWSRCVFVSVASISSVSRCNFFLNVISAGSDKLG